MVLVQDDGDLVRENKARREENLLSGWLRGNKEEAGFRRQRNEEEEARKGSKGEVTGEGGLEEIMRR